MCVCVYASIFWAFNLHHFAYIAFYTHIRTMRYTSCMLHISHENHSNSSKNSLLAIFIGIFQYRMQQDAANQLHSTNKTINYIHNVNKNCILLITLSLALSHPAIKYLSTCMHYRMYEHNVCRMHETANVYGYTIA